METKKNRNKTQNAMHIERLILCILHKCITSSAASNFCNFAPSHWQEKNCIYIPGTHRVLPSAI